MARGKSSRARRKETLFGAEGIAETWRRSREGSLVEFTQPLWTETERFHFGENSRDDREVVAVRLLSREIEEAKETVQAPLRLFAT
jgi:hypothetical protein